MKTSTSKWSPFRLSARFTILPTAGELGEAILKAIEQYDGTVAVLASGSVLAPLY
ncbi:hypothetical protein ACNKHV_27475 [Shigella flexneri]